MTEENTQAPSVATQDLPIEQRFERLAARYKALRHQYDLTKKLLSESQEELFTLKQNGGQGQSLFMGLIGAQAPKVEDPRIAKLQIDISVLKEELESKILENETLVMTLSEVRKQNEQDKEANHALTSEIDALRIARNDLEVSLRYRTDAEATFKEEAARLSKQLNDSQADTASITLSLQTESMRLAEANRDLELANSTITSLQAEVVKIGELSTEADLLRAEAAAAALHAANAARTASLTAESNEALNIRIAELQDAMDVLKASQHVPHASEVSTEPGTPRQQAKQIQVAQLIAQIDWLEGRHNQMAKELGVAASSLARERILKEDVHERLIACEAVKQELERDMEMVRRAYEQQIEVISESACQQQAQLDELTRKQEMCSHCGTVANCEHAICDDCHGGGVLTRTIFQ